MHAGGSRLAGSVDGSGGLTAPVWVPLAEVHLEFLSGRCRPNTVRVAAPDLKVFFTVVATVIRVDGETRLLGLQLPCGTALPP